MAAARGADVRKMNGPAKFVAGTAIESFWILDFFGLMDVMLMR